MAQRGVLGWWWLNDTVDGEPSMNGTTPSTPAADPALTSIPFQLQDPGFRFIKLRRGAKEPIELWRDPGCQYEWNDGRLLHHLSTVGNYGIVTGAGRLCCFDADDVDRLDGLGITDPFKDTFTVSTGRGTHYYFLSDFTGKAILSDPEDKTRQLGDIRGGAGFYLVAPGSVHPSGSRYEVTHDAPLKEIDAGTVRAAVREVLPIPPPARAVNSKTNHSARGGGTITDRLGLRCEDFLIPVRATRHGDELIGSHPVHGSETGSNLHVNVHKNTWHCHRCNTGGGALEAFAVSEGIISCDQVQPGCLDNRWSDVLKALEKRGYQLPQQAPQAGRSDDEKRHELHTSMEACRDEAIGVLQNDFLQYLHDTFSLIHSGDQETITTVALAIASQSIVNSQGIQPALGGEKGTGKTSSVKAALHLISPDWIMEGSVSDKAIFRFLETPGRIVFSDDVTLSPDINATIKRAMSNFQGLTPHRTLDKDRKPIVIPIAPRQIFILTSVSDQGDDQLSDRQFKISFQKTDKNNSNFLDFVAERELTGQEELPLLHEVHVCRAAWEEIKTRQFRVINPYAKRIRFTDPGHRRDVIMLFDFIKAFAVLRFMQRNQRGNLDNVIILEADAQDVEDAIKAFTAMGPQIQALKLSKDEMSLWQFITIDQGGEVSFPDLVERYAAGGAKSATYTRLRRLIEGREGSGGLLDKIAGMTVTRELREVSDSKRRNVKVIRCHTKPKLNEYVEFATFEPITTKEEK